MQSLYCILMLILTFGALARGENFDWQERPLREDLYVTRNSEIKQKQDFEKLNEATLNALYSYSPELASGRVTGITYSQAQSVMNKLFNNPIYQREM